MKQSRSNRLWSGVAVMVVTVMAICSCDEATIYDSYRHVNISGWERTDTLTFAVPPVKQAGDYMEVMGIRANGEYPFMELCMVVEQMVIPSNMVRTDTLVCNITSSNGTPRGHGVNYYQYQLPIGNIRLAQGDSLHVIVHHNMRKENLRGVADVGLKITKR